MNAAIQRGQSVVLAYTLPPPLIERAGHRAVLNHCMCRQAEGCRAILRNWAGALPLILCYDEYEGDACRVDPKPERVTAPSSTDRSLKRGTQ